MSTLEQSLESGVLSQPENDYPLSPKDDSPYYANLSQKEIDALCDSDSEHPGVSKPAPAPAKKATGKSARKSKKADKSDAHEISDVEEPNALGKSKKRKSPSSSPSKKEAVTDDEKVEEPAKKKKKGTGKKPLKKSEKEADPKEKKPRKKLSEQMSASKDRFIKAQNNIKFTPELLEKRIETHYDAMLVQSLPAFQYLERTFIESEKSEERDGDYFFITKDVKAILDCELDGDNIDLDSPFIKKINKNWFKMSEKAYHQHQEVLEQQKVSRSKKMGEKVYLRLKNVWVMGERQGFENKLMGPMLEAVVATPQEIVKMCEDE